MLKLFVRVTRRDRIRNESIRGTDYVGCLRISAGKQIEMI